MGFRPFVYNLAKKLSLVGFVLNNPQGVILEVQGRRDNLDDFVSSLQARAPSISTIDSITCREIPLQKEKEFSIKESVRGGERFTRLPRDMVVCNECLEEFFDQNDRRFLYPFINCTQCGPRYSIIRDVPYDRKATTMKAFTMCKDCLLEYENPQNRRFHAQPNACFKCGPKMSLIQEGKDTKTSTDPVELSAELLFKGEVVAIKGLGGYHLACNAKDTRAVRILREIKQRPHKPFALMADRVNFIESFCQVNSKEKELLLSKERPIVLLKIKKKNNWTHLVAPHQEYLGIMLAYTPLHYIIFKYLRLQDKEPLLVMTSANKKDLPLMHREEDIFSFKRKVRYFLISDRDINNACDDSIARENNGTIYMLRKARGFSPDILQAPFTFKSEILATGAELKNTFSLAKEDKIITSVYIGDLKNLATFNFYKKNIGFLKNIFSVHPKVYAYDLHPEYLSTKYALKEKNKSIKVLGIQHHHAHIASCMFENNLRAGEKVIGVCFDGLGYGSDATIWGGEFFLADCRDFERAGHIEPFGLLGGDEASQQPWRIGFYFLYKIFKDTMWNLDIEFVRNLDKKKCKVLKKLLNSNLTPYTSSMGRIFDAASSLLGIRDIITYEAQAAIELEMLATRYRHNEPKGYSFEIKPEGKKFIIKIDNLIKEIVDDLQHQKEKSAIAFRFHVTIKDIICKVCALLKGKWGIDKVVLSGGVFQNKLLLDLVTCSLPDCGFRVYTHSRIPTNDEGISVGQLIIANCIL